MAQDVVGSKLPTFASDQTTKSTRGFGQNGYGGASSETPGKARLISKGLSDVSPPLCVIPANNQVRTVSAKPIKSASNMHSPDKAGDKVPSAVNRK